MDVRKFYSKNHRLEWQQTSEDYEYPAAGTWFDVSGGGYQGNATMGTVTVTWYVSFKGSQIPPVELASRRAASIIKRGGTGDTVPESGISQSEARILPDTGRDTIKEEPEEE